MRTIQAAVARKVAVKQQPQLRAQPQGKYQKKKLKVIDNRRRQSLSLPEIPFPVFIMSVSVITAGIILNVAQQALVSQLSYETESVKKEIQLAQQIQDKLLAEKSILESPQRIESVAVNKLSMVKAPKVSYLRIANRDQVDTKGSNESSSANAVHSGKTINQEKSSSGGNLTGSVLTR
ncbi:MAG: hypothetical protein K6T91_02425 [Firmicutes bacterium]|nr:hypothetical protein [Bacillota bacterium]